MDIHPVLKWLVPLIFVLALIAALAELRPGEGTPYPLTNFRGEEVTINARGLYYWRRHSCRPTTWSRLCWACPCWRYRSGWPDAARRAGGCCWPARWVLSCTHRFQK
jgi:hypothetical protein